MIKVVNKGYTLTVVSWENDGDSYNTLTKTVDTLEEAKEYYQIMQICKSKNKGVGLGNTHDNFDDEQMKLIINTIKKLSILLKKYDITENNLENEDDILDIFYDMINDLLGGSEFYACRVMESCIITYSDKDIYVDEIKIKLNE